MNQTKINFKEKYSKFTKHWSPRIIAEMNDYQFKLAKLQGEFVWHNHPDTDEVFIVIEGSMCIELEENVSSCFIRMSLLISLEAYSQYHFTSIIFYYIIIDSYK